MVACRFTTGHIGTRRLLPASKVCCLEQPIPRSTMKRAILPALLVCAVFVPMSRGGDDDNPAKEALQALNDFVGSWNGAGSNMSKSENWSEKASWSWKFK